MVSDTILHELTIQEFFDEVKTFLEKNALIKFEFSRVGLSLEISSEYIIPDHILKTLRSLAEFHGFGYDQSPCCCRFEFHQLF